MKTLLVLLTGALLVTACGSKTSNAPAANKPQAVSRQEMAAHEEILAKVKDIVASKLGLDPKVIDVDKPLAQQKVAAREIDVVDIILDVEDAFKVDVTEQETGGTEKLADRLTVRKLADIVASKKK